VADNYDSFWPKSGPVAEHRKVIEDYTKEFCRRRNRRYREVLNDAIILAFNAAGTYDPTRASFETWLLHCLKALGRRTQYLGLYGGSTIGMDGRTFTPPTKKTKWGTDEPTGRETRNNNFWEIETPQQWAKKKQHRVRAIIQLDRPRSAQEKKLASAVKEVRPKLTLMEAGVLQWWLDCLSGKHSTMEQAAVELGMSGKGQVSKVFKRVLEKLKEHYQNLILPESDFLETSITSGSYQE
jgi:hypothetical protein